MDFQDLSTIDGEAKKHSRTGYLAKKFGGVAFPLEVLPSVAGYYLGTLDENREPYSQESVEYWSTRDEAEIALNSKISGAWTQRCSP